MSRATIIAAIQRRESIFKTFPINLIAEENKESCLDVRLSINICKNYNVKVQKLADICK